MLLRKHGDVVLLIVAGAGVMVNLWLTNATLGLVSFGLWVGAGMWRCSHLLPSPRKFERWLFGVLALGCAVATVALGVYFSLPVTAWSSAAALVFITTVLIILPVGSAELKYPRSALKNLPGRTVGVTLVCQLGVLVLLCAARTSEPLVSPWLVLPSSIFLLFLIATGLCAYLCATWDERALFIASFQVFLAVGVSVLVYGIGFGFDPFIHRAAETALVTTGHIQPLSLLYSGQYALVGCLHFLSRLPVSTLDIWLLPLGFSLLLPGAAYIGLRYGWGVRREVASLGWLAGLFIPFMLFTFTVPFSMTYGAFAVLLFLFPLTRSRWWWGVLGWFSLLLVFFHPLLGVPLMCLMGFSGAAYRMPTRATQILTACAFVVGVAVGVPLLLLVYQHQVGTTVMISSLWHNVVYFLSLFIDPFGKSDPNVLWEYNALYILRYWQPVVLTCMAYPFLLALDKKYRRPGATLVAFMLGLTACAYAVSTLFVFKGIIDHEQQEFALRLLQSIYIVPLPILLLVLEKVWSRVWWRLLVLAGLVFLATTSWYFSYPQFNAKFAYYSPSVSSYDLEAVQFIDTDSQGQPYLVLSNQMTSAAALQKFGFAHYYPLHGQDILWYAIPTGGELYGYYLNLIYGRNPGDLTDLMNETQTNYVYVVMPSYWSWGTDMLQQLEVQSSQHFFIEDKITIYRFDRYAGSN